MKTTKILSLLFIAVLAFSSCKKEVVGPQGPAGPAGTNGNANVRAATYTLTAGTYVAPSWQYTLNNSNITNDILATGAVFVYLQQGSNYSQLPYTVYPSTAYSRSYRFESFWQGVKIYITDSDQQQPPDPGTLVVKVVTMAGVPKSPGYAVTMNPDL